jgi:tRNA G10  N-methylase Trm11
MMVSMDSYAFILGRQPRLALAEILARLDAEDPTGALYQPQAVGKDFFRVDLEAQIGPAAFFARLGGSVKLVKMLDQQEAPDSKEAILNWLGEHLVMEHSGSGRLTFGLSLHGHLASFPVPSSTEIKRWLNEQGISSRFLESKGGESKGLSSAQVEKSGMLDEGDGADLCLFGEEARLILGKTVQVQQFEDFSERDYGKPERRIDRGILPPKLARIMLNLSGLPPGRQVLDPFCGSGILLVEGLLLGYRMTGVDVDPEAIDSSKKNLKWAREQYGRLSECRVLQGDARGSVRKFGPFSFDAVVSEGDLGPNLSQFFSKKSVLKLVNDLKPMYITCLSELRSVIRPGGRIVLAVPRWSLKEGGDQGLGLRPMLRLMGYREMDWTAWGRGVVPDGWAGETLVYRRPGQKTAREILWFKA